MFSLQVAVFEDVNEVDVNRLRRALHDRAEHVVRHTIGDCFAKLFASFDRFRRESGERLSRSLDVKSSTLARESIRPDIVLALRRNCGNGIFKCNEKRVNGAVAAFRLLSRCSDDDRLAVSVG